MFSDTENSYEKGMDLCEMTSSCSFTSQSEVHKSRDLQPRVGGTVMGRSLMCINEIF